MNVDILIGRYLLATAEHFGSRVEAGERRAVVHAGNRAADELRRLAVEIGTNEPVAVRAFGRLLDEPRNEVNAWAAFHLLEVMTAPVDLVDRAFGVLESIAHGDGPTALGTRMRLKELRAQFGRNIPGSPGVSNRQDR